MSEHHAESVEIGGELCTTPGCAGKNRRPRKPRADFRCAHEVNQFIESLAKRFNEELVLRQILWEGAVHLSRLLHGTEAVGGKHDGERMLTMRGVWHLVTLYGLNSRETLENKETR